MVRIDKEFPKDYDKIVNNLTAELMKEASLAGCEELVDVKIDSSYFQPMVAVTVIAK